MEVRDLALPPPVFPSWPLSLPQIVIMSAFTQNTPMCSRKTHICNGILSSMIIVVSSSAWAGLEEEAPVDEVEAVRISQRGASRVCHYPEKMAHKSNQ